VVEIQEIAAIIGAIGGLIVIIVMLYMHLDRKITELDRKMDVKLKELDERIAVRLREFRGEIGRDLEGLALVFYKLLEILKDKGMLDPGDVFKVFGSEYIQRYSGRLSNPDSLVEARKAELIRKAQARLITYEEALELQKLLEEQKQKHESAGDIVGAILALILLLALVWLISELFKKD